jgi:hypothetical protein
MDVNEPKRKNFVMKRKLIARVHPSTVNTMHESRLSLVCVSRHFLLSFAALD